MTKKARAAKVSGDVLAAVVINGAKSMSADTREELAKWLYALGKDLVTDGDSFPPVLEAEFTG